MLDYHELEDQRNNRKFDLNIVYRDIIFYNLKTCLKQPNIDQHRLQIYKWMGVVYKAESDKAEY